MANTSRNFASKSATCGSPAGTATVSSFVRGLSRAARLQLGHQPFRLPHVQAFLDDALGGELLLFFVGQAENHLRVADGKPAFAQIIFGPMAGNLSSRSALATAARLLPTLAAMSSCVS